MCAAHTPYLHLAGVGLVPVARADALRVGDEVMWQHGNRTRVEGIHRDGGRVVLTLDMIMATPYPRTMSADAPVAASRDGQWVGVESGQRLVCRVRLLGLLGRPCSAEVDEAGRCRLGHYPPPDRLALHSPLSD